MNRAIFALAAVVLSASMQAGHAHALDACPEHLRGLREMALSLEHGEGVAKDSQQALAHYCEAARLGDAEAQYSAGWMVANGRGVTRDDALAAYFFDLAARQNHPQARKLLALMSGEKSGPPPCMAEPEIQDPPEARNLPFAAGPMEMQETALTPQDIHDLLDDASPRQKRVAAVVAKLAPRYGVSPRLAMAVIRAESNFNPQAVSPRNAQGLMQLIPETAERFNVRKPFDIEQNIRGGLSYLRWLLAYFKGNVTLVAAAYNAGEGTVNRYRGIPPFPETRDYVRRIKSVFQWDEHPFDPAITEPSPELARMRLVMK